MRERRYWHPRYGKKPLPETWRTIGYPYYVGGTSYVVVEPTVVPSVSAERVEASPSDATGTSPPAAVDDRLGELQDLIDLVHEWRTMNESAGLHKRIQAAIEMKQAAETLASIKTENEAFDKATRAAMRGLAAGRSVADALQAANTHWEELTELVESLPEPSAPGELPES
ncbi:MAG: hypothetical protein JXA69_02825 [Phycisphaerae bacterium]|nr:hypothetical protein [Phycisphaerae bacterium]